tara:strand:- start:554 stop:940 length:387 start_codon:yes stop_codon:yes gene_type:complete
LRRDSQGLKGSAVTDRDGEDLSEFDRRLKAARGDNRSPFDSGKPGQPPKYGMLGLALRMGLELVSALAVGAAAGWGLDKWLETSPWIMIVGVVMGGVAGIMNVYRFAAGFGGTVGYKKAASKEDAPDA